MNFKELIKQEWEKEFPNKEDFAPRFDESIFYHTFGEVVERICIKVWNQAVDKARDVLYDNQMGTELEEAQLYAIEKLKINEQGTDTTEV